MVSVGTRERDGTGRARRRLSKVAGLALGVAMMGTVGFSGTFAQDDDISVGTTDADAMVDEIIAGIFGEIFGGGAADDGGAASGGDVNLGGNTGGSVMMGGSTGGGITIGGGGGGSGSGSSGGGITVGDQSGG